MNIWVDADTCPAVIRDILLLDWFPRSAWEPEAEVRIPTQSVGTRYDLEAAAALAADAGIPESTSGLQIRRGIIQAAYCPLAQQGTTIDWFPCSAWEPEAEVRIPTQSVATSKEPPLPVRPRAVGGGDRITPARRTAALEHSA